LTAPKGDGTRWDVELSVTYLLYSPRGVANEGKGTAVAAEGI
jgi:hypothetical protein